jgi:hypothetical protein
MDEPQRREFHEALLDAHSFEDLPGRWQAATLKAEQNRAEAPADLAVNRRRTAAALLDRARSDSKAPEDSELVPAVRRVSPPRRSSCR